MSLRATTAAAFLTLALAAACIGTPQPDPPNVDIDKTLIEGSRSRGDEEVTLSGLPGAIVPSGALLRITNLDRLDPPVVVWSESDGSFGVTVPGEAGDELRLRAGLSGGSSAPVDIVLNDLGVSLAPRPLAHCLIAEPDLVARVDAGEPLSIRVTNSCGQTVTLSRIELRRPGELFSVVGPATPADVADGAWVEVTVTFSGGTSAEEEVLLIESSAPEIDRRAVTLAGLP